MQRAGHNWATWTCTNSVVVVSGEQWRDSGINVSILPQTPSHPCWHITFSYTVSPCWLYFFFFGYPLKKIFMHFNIVDIQYCFWVPHQPGSVLHIPVPVPSWVFYPQRSLQVELSVFCYFIHPCWWCVLHIHTCIYYVFMCCVLSVSAF